MAVSQHKYVPKFGNWESEEPFPYTVYFDKARTRRNAAKINPNSTQQNHNTFVDNHTTVQASPFQTETKTGVQNWREDGDLRRPTESPWYHRTVDIEVAINSLVHRPGRKMTTRQQNAVFDHRIGRSPISPWERNYSIGCGNSLAPLSPGGSRLRSVKQGAETPDHIAAVPKFGDWDESDPASVDRFTNIFNKLREERLKGTGNVAAEALGNPDYEDLKQHKNGTFKKCFCFPIPW